MHLVRSILRIYHDAGHLNVKKGVTQLCLKK